MAITRSLRSTGITPLHTTKQSAPSRCIGTFGLAVGAACAFFPWHRRLGSHVPYKSTTGIADPAANETMLGLRRALGTEVVHWLGANKPAYTLDPGFLEHPRLSPRAVIGPGARFLDFLFTGAPRRRRSPGGDWPTLATPLRSSHSRPRH